MAALEGLAERLVGDGATRVERFGPGGMSNGFIVMQDPRGQRVLPRLMWLMLFGLPADEALCAGRPDPPSAATSRRLLGRRLRRVVGLTVGWADVGVAVPCDVRVEVFGGRLLPVQPRLYGEDVVAPVEAEPDRCGSPPGNATSSARWPSPCHVWRSPRSRRPGPSGGIIHEG